MGRKTVRNIFIVLFCLAFLGVSLVFAVNFHVKSSVGGNIVSNDFDFERVDCIVVLGCKVHENGSLSHMLRDRLIRAIELYKSGVAPKILMSGDHGSDGYDEVNAMKQFAIENGVPSEDVFMDHAGFSTYETVYRAKEIFKAEKIVIVTQEYHLYRALYIADRFDIEAKGVSSDLNTYAGQYKRDLREVLARCKDFFTCIFKPDPTYLGEAIPVFGDGNVTNG
jgi:vancomycin permeability regulator SanA